MNTERIVNGSVGLLGTAVASLTPEAAAAVFAGVATGLWMLRQIWLSFRPVSPRSPDTPAASHVTCQAEQTAGESRGRQR